MSDTGCSRLISVLAFYIFSCSCFHSPQASKPSREARNEFQLLWREEIESGPIPSFVRNNNSRQSSRDSSRANSRSWRGDGASASSKTISQFSLSVAPDTGLRPLDSLIPDAEMQKNQRITTVTISELPKIHPSINDRHPPVVSALPESRTATAWMTLPPPPARVMKAINRATHTRKTSRRIDINSPQLDVQPTGLSVTPIALCNSTAVPSANVGLQGQDNEWERRYRADPETCNTSNTTTAPRSKKERLYDILPPKFGTHPDAEYKHRFFDSRTGGIKTHRPPNDEEAPRSTATLVEMIQRPSPALESPFLSPLSLNVFEDIYG